MRVDTVVLVLTDVEGSARLWADEPAHMDLAMQRHHTIVHGAVEEHGGWRPVDQGEGDAVFAAFRSATDALGCAAEVQRRLAAEDWPTSRPLRVRVAVHAGEAIERDGNLFGDSVNRCARLRGLGSGGQTLVSAAVYELVRDRLPAGISLLDLGEHRMKDLVRPERVWQLDVAGLAASFPPLASLDRAKHNLPVAPSPLIGRDDDLIALTRLLHEHRLLTLTGFGGMGKTRLALQVGAELVDSETFPDGVWFVDLSAATDPAAVPSLIAETIALRETGSGPAAAVLAGLSEQRLLLVLDNLEQVIGCAPFVAELLARCPGVRVLATTREPLRIRGEHEYSVAPLAMPRMDHSLNSGGDDIEGLMTYAAVRLFVDRAVAVRPDFTVTNTNAPAVAAICARLDGHPLAIELAAARTRILAPDALLARLDDALSMLTGGSRDLPRRQQTLRATIAWSYDALGEAERCLLDRLSIFTGSFTLDAAESVCAPALGDGPEIDVLDTVTSLVERSLVRALPRADDDLDGRYSLLASIREFAGSNLSRSERDELGRRHYEHTVRRTALAPSDTRTWQVITQVGKLHLHDLRAAFAWARDGSHESSLATFPVTLALALRTTGALAEAVDTCRAVLAAAHPPTVQGVLHAHILGVLAAITGPDRLEAEVLTWLGAAAADGRHPEYAVLESLFAARRAGGLDEPRRYLARAGAALSGLEPASSVISPGYLRQVRDNFVLMMPYVDIEAALRIGRDVCGRDSAFLQRQHLLNFVTLLTNLGEIAEATALGPRLELADQLEDPVARGMTVVRLATLSVAQGDVEGARAQLAGIADLAHRVQVANLTWSLDIAQATCDLEESRPGDAADRLGSYLERPSAEHLWGVSAWRWARARRLVGDGSPERTAAALEEARVVLWRGAARVLPDLICCLVELGVRTRDVTERAALLAPAAAYFERIVVRRSVQQDLDTMVAEIDREIETGWRRTTRAGGSAT
ncbi:MAG TPA: adenylate/guanylate cyclase domain-containing protein [Mycobacteriales bacterium]|nr:adenylate/guanylate cyclase domain-containing protein [Mycobacteriales bacterium]